LSRDPRIVAVRVVFQRGAEVLPQGRNLTCATISSAALLDRQPRAIPAFPRHACSSRDMAFAGAHGGDEAHRERGGRWFLPGDPEGRWWQAGKVSHSGSCVSNAANATTLVSCHSS